MVFRVLCTPVDFSVPSKIVYMNKYHAKLFFLYECMIAAVESGVMGVVASLFSRRYEAILSLVLLAVAVCVGYSSKRLYL